MTMHKKLFVLIFLALLGHAGIGQSLTTLSVDVGGSLTSFQDNKFSQVRFNGTGGVFGLEYQRLRPQYRLSTRLQVMSGTETASTHDQGKTTNVNPRLELGYHRKVKENLYLGVQWDVFNFYSKDVEGLGNNRIYYLTSSNLFASGFYDWKKFRFGLDLGLLSYAKEGTGFSFSAPQAATEGEEFDYLDDALVNPFRLRFGKITGIGPNLHLRTHIQYQISRRWNLGYEWNFRRYVQVPGYASSMGYNMLNLKFDILDKAK